MNDSCVRLFFCCYPRVWNIDDWLSIVKIFRHCPVTTARNVTFAISNVGLLWGLLSTDAYEQVRKARNENDKQKWRSQCIAQPLSLFFYSKFLNDDDVCTNDLI